MYSFSRSEVDNSGLGVVGQEKYNSGLMLWGGITNNGLFPKNRHVFFNEWLSDHCVKIGKKKKTLDNKIYATFLTEFVAPKLKQQFGADAATKIVWQDDCDTKHRTKHVITTVDQLFAERIAVNEQSAKMADIWPIENV